MATLQVIDAAHWYEVVPMAEGVSLIHEPWIKDFCRCNIWHVRGRDRDLLLDTGMGVVSLRQTVSLVAERPVICVASHTHFDHIGCHHEFPDRRVHASEADILADPRRDTTLAEGYVGDYLFHRLPPRWDAATYKVAAAPASAFLAEGDVIDLGDRAFEVLHVPGHSPGGIALFEAKTRILLSGDIVYDGELLDDLEGSNGDDYEASLLRLSRLPADTVHAGHFASFGNARLKVLIDEYIAGRRRAGCPVPPIFPARG